MSKGTVIYRFSTGILITALLWLAGCVDPFMPDVEMEDYVLVIEGTITNAPGPQQVWVSRSAGLLDREFKGMSHVHVEAVNDKGDVVLYSSRGDGKFETVFPEDLLETGSAWMLRVIAGDGKIYESSMETLYSCPEIDTAWAVIEENRNDPTLEISRGYQVYISTEEFEAKADFYRWEVVYTWEYHAPHVPDIVVEKPTSPNVKNGVSRYLSQTEKDTTRVCWVTENLGDVYTRSVEQLEKKKIEQMPLNFVSFSDPYAKWGCSLLIKQYSISQAAYDYYHALYGMSADAGGLYETQPYSIEGNFECVSDPDTKVLGYFSVSSSTQKRIFLDAPDEYVYSPSCRLQETSLRDLREQQWNKFPAYAVIREGYMTQEDICFNCYHTGGNRHKPAFWKD